MLSECVCKGVEQQFLPRLPSTNIKLGHAAYNSAKISACKTLQGHAGSYTLAAKDPKHRKLCSFVVYGLLLLVNYELYYAILICHEVSSIVLVFVMLYYKGGHQGITKKEPNKETY